jgi:hypothetical protein
MSGGINTARAKKYLSSVLSGWRVATNAIT